MAKPSMSMKSKSMEMEPGEGKKHEMAETPQEELREGAEPDDMPAGKTNRKRSAKGAKNTKAPMDGENCSCGARKGKASCDGNCGGYGKKMDRNDALTPQEYLAACDLGIQGRSRSYIRARLDTAERLDLKCGKGSISEGEKCHVGPTQKVQPKSSEGSSKITLTGKETGIFSRERIKREGYYGAQLGGNAFSRKSQAKRYGAYNAAAGAAIGGVAGALLTGNAKSAALGALGGAAYGALAGAAGGAITAQVNRSTSRAANRSLQREKFEKPIASRHKTTRAAMQAGGATGRQLGEYDMKTAMTLARGYDRINARTQGRYGADSIYADGFSPDLKQLAI
jgi:hypothetical protein